ncbi:MAG: manganese efflux pump [Lachnospiraceae bacterium]|nr:manganese efflux pump [Lachnospiraceae bacterium]
MSSAFAALFLFLTAVSIDSLTAGLTYGTQRVFIKPLSYLILVCVPAAFITAANRIGSHILGFLPEAVLPFLSFTLLMILGFSKLSESLIRLLAHKHPSLTRNWGCKIKQINIIFTVYLSPEDANQDDLQILTPKEALLLSLALSLDSVLVGMAFHTEPIPLAVLFLLAALFNLLLFAAGYGFGQLISSVLHIDLSWLSGLFLLLLAIQALL